MFAVFIQVLLRCTMIWKIHIGGMGWREMLQILCLSVSLVSKWSWSIRDPLDYCSNCLFQSEKWDMIAMDFVSGYPRTSSCYDAIWVIMDRLTKTTHFLPIKKTYSTGRLVRLYVNRIVCLHWVPVSIISERGATFTSVFWQELHKAMETRLDFNTVFHPQIDGQSKRTIQTLEDMLRMCVMDFSGQWDFALAIYWICI